MKFPAKGAFNVYDKTIAKGKLVCSFRFDTPHKGAPTHHININPKISGVPDSHIPISFAQFSAAKSAGKVLDKINKFALPVAVAIDTYRLGRAVYKDYKSGTIRNVVETGASIAGGWGGGYGGAVAGATIGTAIFPGPGTFGGAIVGGIAGGLGGSFGAEKLTKIFGDKYSFNMEERKCRECKTIFIARIYKDEKDQLLSQIFITKVLCEKCVVLFDLNTM
uniref:Glycine zipper domain-containing protein n=1 Tax=Panagrolaimus davidi TaxID=227884 RepID=A0A914PZG2_9BILA